MLFGNLLNNYLGFSQAFLHPSRPSSGPRIALSRTWQVLGPFQLGTREAPWGADPLEFEGGFQALNYSPTAWFRSALVRGADVPWTVFNSKSFASGDDVAKLTLEVGFGEVDWPHHQRVFGWSALQYQTWARGFIDIKGESTQNVVLYTDSVLEFVVDGLRYFGGDFYSLRRAPVVLHLKPGRHSLDIRMIRDVRAMGGFGVPNVEISLEARIAKETMEMGKAGILMPDVVDGKLVSSLGSFSLRNTGQATMKLVGIWSANEDVQLKLHRKYTEISPGQTRPVSFDVELLRDTSEMEVHVIYSPVDEPGFQLSFRVKHTLRHRPKGEGHVVTFLHPGEMVSYMVLRPPRPDAGCPKGRDKAPVFLALHGAGVEANSEMLVHSLDGVSDLCAWVIFPTGTSTWSGDDWHTWGTADAEAAIEHVPAWIKTNKWQGIGVDTNRWFVAGHSNGGQGTWYMLFHQPDKVIAAAPVSGYSSIQTYVPYHLWQYADPRQIMVIQASLNSFRHELMVDNAKGIPTMLQHGRDDDNVPSYHGRLMHLRMYLAGTNTSYVEIPGGHWFDGVMETIALKDFYYEILNQDQGPRKDEQNFRLVVANPADTGSKQGVKVQRLMDPAQFGKMDVVVEAETKQCRLNTSNIRAFELDERYDRCHTTYVDYEEFPYPKTLYQKSEGVWHGSDEGFSCARNERALHQMGGIDAILRTRGRLSIVYQGDETCHLALQTSRNLVQYYGADADMMRKIDRSGKGNVLSIYTGDDMPATHFKDFPIRVKGREVRIRVNDTAGAEHRYRGEDAVAAILVRPINRKRLELVVWGRDVEAAALAARLIPTMTGVGQPDFVVLSNSCRWRGVGGVAAMGFFDHRWQVSRSSYFS